MKFNIYTVTLPRILELATSNKLPNNCVIFLEEGCFLPKENIRIFAKAYSQTWGPVSKGRVVQMLCKRARLRFYELEFPSKKIEGYMFIPKPSDEIIMEDYHNRFPETYSLKRLLETRTRPKKIKNSSPQANKDNSPSQKKFTRGIKRARLRFYELGFSSKKIEGYMFIPKPSDEIRMEDYHIRFPETYSLKKLLETRTRPKKIKNFSPQANKDNSPSQKKFTRGIKRDIIWHLDTIVSVLHNSKLAQDSFGNCLAGFFIDLSAIDYLANYFPRNRDFVSQFGQHSKSEVKKSLLTIISSKENFLLLDDDIKVVFIFNQKKYFKKKVGRIIRNVIAKKDYKYYEDTFFAKYPFISFLPRAKDNAEIQLEGIRVVVSSYALFRFSTRSIKCPRMASLYGSQLDNPRGLLLALALQLRKSRKVKRKNSLKQLIKHNFIYTEYREADSWIFVVEDKNVLKTCYPKGDKEKNMYKFLDK